MQTVAQIFDKLGGHAAVAEKTGIPLTTVHSWKRANFIPEWRRPAVLAVAKKVKAEISPSDFPERSTKPSERAA